MRDSIDFDFSGFWQQNQKLVVIVGAGVSREAGIPVGTEIVEKILTDLDGSLVRRIVEQTRGGEAKNANFFQVLAVYKDVVGEKKFWDFLGVQLKYFETNQMAAFSESYDLLAHLLHYENLAAIISLNFDELLDKALELESQSKNSAKIIRPVASLSDFAAVLDDIRRDPDATQPTVFQASWHDRKTSDHQGF